MKTEYCSACGSKNLYELHSPKFCSSCGAGMSSSGISSGALLGPPSDPEIVDECKIPSISKLEYEIDLSSLSGKRTTIGSLVGDEDAGPREVLGKRTAPKKRDDYDPVAESIKECLPSREPTEIT